MKTFWKILPLIPIFLVTACVSKALPTDGAEESTADISSQGVVAEENTNQGKPEITLNPVDPTVQVATFPIDLEPAFLDHAKYLHYDWNTLSSSEQASILQDLKDAWQQEMGDLNPGTMKLNGKNLDKFLQFVRVAGGDSFLTKNELSAIMNHLAHSSLKDVLENHDLIAFQAFMDRLHHQVEINNILKDHVLKVAGIYSVPLGATVPSPEEAEGFSGDLGDSIRDALGLDDQATGNVKMRLIDLLRSTILVVKGPNVNGCFLSFGMISEEINGSDEPKGFQVIDRIYGAVSATHNPFVTREN